MAEKEGYWGRQVFNVDENYSVVSYLAIGEYTVSH
jgi:hypothetical protein